MAKDGRLVEQLRMDNKPVRGSGIEMFAILFSSLSNFGTFRIQTIQHRCLSSDKYVTCHHTWHCDDISIYLSNIRNLNFKPLPFQ